MSSIVAILFFKKYLNKNCKDIQEAFFRLNVFWIVKMLQKIVIGLHCC